MTDETSCNPHKEEDEGYLAAEAGLSLSENRYPCGTIRHDDWQRGWRIKNDELRRAINFGEGKGKDDEGYLAAAAGQSLLDNPYPSGTIRHDDWRRGWNVKHDATLRAIRLHREDGG
jgi:hypothetical protein